MTKEPNVLLVFPRFGDSNDYESMMDSLKVPLHRLHTNPDHSEPGGYAVTYNQTVIRVNFHRKTDCFLGLAR
jgi:hypothetical protein